ncbi:MAG: DsbE family thiol:disulfide interchange protein [Pseudomonadota bacterium]
MGKIYVALPPLIFAALAALFLVGMHRDDPNGIPSTFIGKPAPPVILDALGGLDGFDNAALNEPGYKLVNFWASWCAPCRVEHPNLQALADEGFAVFGVNYKDDASNALGFLDELGNPYRGTGTDTGARMAIEWGVYGVPETFLIDHDGTVLMRFAGPVTQRAIREQLRPILTEADQRVETKLSE